MPEKNKNTARGTSGQPAGRKATKEKDYEGTPLSMTGIRNNLMHSTFIKIVLGVLILIFAAGFLFSSRLPSGPLTEGSGPSQPQVAAPEVVGRVADTDLKRDKLDMMFSRILQQGEMFGQKPDPTTLLSAKQQALQYLVEQAIDVKTATDAGLTASEADIDKEIESQIDTNIKARKANDEAAFRREIDKQFPGGGEKAYRDDMRLKYDNRDALRVMVLQRKYEDMLKKQNTTTEDQYKRSVTRLNIRQIMVQPKIVAANEKDTKAAEAKNSAEAKAKAEKLIASLKGLTGPALAKAFDALARKESDDAETKVKGGVVGWKRANELPLDPAIQLQLERAPSNLAGPITGGTNTNFYIFLVEGRKQEGPSDYAKKKATYLKEYEDQKDNEYVAAKQAETRKKFPPEILDPALKAFKIANEDQYSAPPAEQPKVRQQAIDLFTEALTFANPLEKTAILFNQSRLYFQLTQPEKAVDVLKEAVSADGDKPSLRIELARGLREIKKNTEALAQLDEAAKYLDNFPSTPSPYGGGGGNPDDQLRMQLYREYNMMGETKRAQVQKTKMSPDAARSADQRGMGGMGGMR